MAEIYNLLTLIGSREESKLLNWARFYDEWIFFSPVQNCFWGLGILGGFLHSGIYKNVIDVHSCIENNMQVAVIVSVRSVHYCHFT